MTGVKTGSKWVQVFIVVDKNQDEEKILAAIVPEVGKPTAPMWYNKDQFTRWKPYKKN